MIFRQWEDVLAERKTQTRRLIKPGEFASGSRGGGRREIFAVWKDTRNLEDRSDQQFGFVRCSLVVLESLYRLKWHKAMGCFHDKTYAVQPRRGQPAIMYKVDPGGGIFTWDWSRADSRLSITETKRQLKSLGWREARIRITDIRRERLQEISLEDVLAEGVGIKIDGKLYPITVRDVAHEEFARLWGSIYTKPGTQWQDDPETWVLSFELAQQA